MTEFERIARHLLVWFHVANQRYLFNPSNKNWIEHVEALKVFLLFEGAQSIGEIDPDLADKIIQKGQELVSEFPGGEAYLNPSLDYLRQIVSNSLNWFWISGKKFLAKDTPENWAEYQEAYGALRTLEKVVELGESVVEPELAAKIMEKGKAAKLELDALLK